MNGKLLCFEHYKFVPRHTRKYWHIYRMQTNQHTYTYGMQPLCSGVQGWVAASGGAQEEGETPADFHARISSRWRDPEDIVLLPNACPTCKIRYQKEIEDA